MALPGFARVRIVPEQGAVSAPLHLQCESTYRRT